MRVNPQALLNTIILISCIFGTLALIICVLVGTAVVQGICCILLFLLGYVAAKFQDSL
jgi:hypothetical protein